MLKGFGNFLLKELKELSRDPKVLLGMIVIPAVMFPILGMVMNFSIETAKESATKVAVLVVNNDTGDSSKQFVAFLNSSLRVFLVNVSTIDEAIQRLSQYNATEIIGIPAQFTLNITGRNSVRVGFYSVYSGAGVLEGIGSSLVDGLVQVFNRNLAPDMVVAAKSTIVKGKVVDIDPRVLSTLMISQAIALPVTMMVLLSYSMQIAATSVAMEKEEKTLETLLTLPMDRFAILMGKLSGSIIIAGVGALAYMFGFNYYMGSFTGLGLSGQSVDLASLGLVPSPLGYVLLGISLFVTLLSALALAVILSAFAEDVRGAQSLAGYMYPLIFVPSLLLMYVDVNVLPFWLKIVVFAIPYSHPILASKAVTMGDYLTPALGIVYVAAFTIIILYIASRLFATEKILTAKLRFRGLRRKAATRAE